MSDAPELGEIPEGQAQIPASVGCEPASNNRRGQRLISSNSPAASASAVTSRQHTAASRRGFERRHKERRGGGNGEPYRIPKHTTEDRLATARLSIHRLESENSSLKSTLAALRVQLSQSHKRAPQLLGECSSGGIRSGTAAATASPTAASSATRTSSEQAAGGMLSIVNT